MKIHWSIYVHMHCVGRTPDVLELLMHCVVRRASKRRTSSGGPFYALLRTTDVGWTSSGGPFFALRRTTDVRRSRQCIKADIFVSITRRTLDARRRSSSVRQTGSLPHLQIVCTHSWTHSYWIHVCYTCSLLELSTATLTATIN